MNDTIFREKSIERLKSPEQLNEYIRVAGPSVWLVLAAAILLLIGTIAWSVFGTVQTVVNTSALAEGGSVICFVSEEDHARIMKGQTVIVGELEGTVKAVSEEPVTVDLNDPSHYLMKNAGLEEGELCYKVELSVSGLKDGIYDIEIVVESIHPITFVIR